MRKILINGLFAGSIILIVGMISGQVFQLLVPSLVDEYGNEKIFRPWSDPIMSGMYLQPFLSGIILAWIWTKTQTLFTQINNCITQNNPLHTFKSGFSIDKYNTKTVEAMYNKIP